MDEIVQRVALGHGILELANRDSVSKVELEEKFVFLDRLLLPCAISELTPVQIEIVNRYREVHQQDDGLFARAKASRQMFRNLVLGNNSDYVLEVGCGKFPIFSQGDQYSYSAIELDQEAIAYCKQQGLKVDSPDIFIEESKGSSVRDFELIFGSFVFHFHMEDSLLEALSSRLSPKGTMYFNFILQDGFDVFSKLNKLGKLGLNTRIHKERHFAKREFLAEIFYEKNRQNFYEEAIADGVISSDAVEQ